jgi:hypothetical protein
MIDTLHNLVEPDRHAKEVLDTLKNTLPTGDEIFNALKGKSEDYGRVFLRKIQKRLEEQHAK